MTAAMRLDHSAAPSATAAGRFDRSRLAGTNINPQTLLATDYLNHFNEVVMLVDMLPQMPECMDDLEGWDELAYWEHFAASGLRYALLAIEAYDHAPRHVRVPFDEAVTALNTAVRASVRACRAALEANDPLLLEIACARACTHMTALIETTAAIVNGDKAGHGAGNGGSHGLDGSSGAPAGANEHPQAAIDALFFD